MMDSDQDDMYAASDPEDYHDNQVEEADDKPSLSNHHENYKILGNAEIRERQEDDIRRVCSVLSVPRVSATILLSHYKWSVSKVHEEWFEDDQKIRWTVGLLEKPTVDYSEFKDITCAICFDTYDYDSDKMLAASCGHLFCCSCWKGFVSLAINDGPGCLALRCPEPSCRAAVGQDMVNLVASEESRGKYSYYLLRSYIDNNRKTKWCPAPGCDYAVEFDVAGGSSESYDVLCQCSCNFCWNCCEEVHRPVDCETVSKWILKNSSEAENTNWILAHAKPCPKCKRPIEKNEGCMHMTCTEPCKFQFCWLCLRGWNEHGSQSCNRYNEANGQGVFDESERRRQIARKSIEKYTHYYERWATNNSSRNKALADLQKMETVNLKTLSVQQCQDETQLIFLVEAWQQIVECRRVLKWTYAYGYYLPESELAKKHFFEFAQGEAEAGLERLHMCAEKDLQTFLDSKEPTDGPVKEGSLKAFNDFLDSKEPTDGPVKEGSLKAFNDFRTKLTGLTDVTRDYFKKLVQALENGLSDVGNSSSSKTLVSSSSEGKAGGKQKRSRIHSNFSIDDSDYWYCERCTYANVSARTMCEMCENNRFPFY